MRYLGTRDVPIGELAVFPGNPRVHDERVLEESARTTGQYRSVVARQLGDGSLQLLAGHGTTAAFAATGATSVRVEVIEADDAEARRIVVVDNRANDLAGYDDQLLAALLGDLEGAWPGTGFDQADLDALLAGLSEPAVNGDPDDAPDPPAEPVTQPGDVWVLGEHRLVCGDATDPGAYAALLGADRAGCMWTDPPYGVDYVGKTKDALTIEGDGAAGLPALLAAAFTATTQALAPGAAAYVAHPASALHTIFASAFVGAGWSLRQTLVWVKDALVLGHSDYHYRHEPIYFGYTALGGEGRRGRGGDNWYGDNAQTSVFEVPRPIRSAVHPTMKPVELIRLMLVNSAAPGSLVLDPFAGSGSTLIAAHLCGRRARLIELDPAYCDVICARWQALSGVVPVLESTGEVVDFLAEDPLT